MFQLDVPSGSPGAEFRGQDQAAGVFTRLSKPETELRALSESVFP